MKMKWIRCPAVIAAFLCLALPYACDGKKEPEAAQPGVRTVVDMAGRTVTLPATIERIGTLGAVGVLNTFVELMGEGKKICNDMPEHFRSGRWHLQYAFAPQIKGGPVFEIGRELRIETLILSKPDVCFTMSIETAETLARNNLACVYLKWTDIDDIKTAVTLMGEVLNKPDVAAHYIRYVDEKLAFATARITDIPMSERPRVVYGNPVQGSQPHGIAEWWITMAGGISVTKGSHAGGGIRYTLEDLLYWDPQVIIATSFQVETEMLQNPAYSGISAVKNRAFHVMPTVGHTWGNRTVEQPLSVFWALHTLYPERLPRAELAREIKYFYSTFFLYDLSEPQLDAIIDGRSP